MPDAPSMLAAPLETLGLPVRLTLALASLGARTLGELAVLTEQRLLRSPSIGRRSVADLRELLARHGLVFGMPAGIVLAAPPPAAPAAARDADTLLAQSQRNAARWYRSLAEQGHAPAHNLLGYMHQFGVGVARDPAQARHHYATAARAGYAPAVHNLHLLTRGTGTAPEDPDTP
jgi:hypothetical protein